MPAAAAVVFDAFHYHHWKARWDSLVADTQISGGAPCPYVGAISTNSGAGVLRPLAMETEFVAFERPRLAAATMRGRSFPFGKWAASMRHVPLEGGHSTLIYTYTLETRPAGLRWLMEPVVDRIFLRATRRRFGRLAAWLEHHGPEVRAWQLAGHAEPKGARPSPAEAR